MEAEIPRLTSVLRSALRGKERGVDPFDIDNAKILREKKLQSEPARAPAKAAGELAREVFGPTAVVGRLPKASREPYESFLRAASLLLLVDEGVPGDELQPLAAEVFRLMVEAGVPGVFGPAELQALEETVDWKGDKEGSAVARRAREAEVRRAVRDGLKKRFGAFDDGHLSAAMTLCGTLRSMQLAAGGPWKREAELEGNRGGPAAPAHSKRPSSPRAAYGSNLSINFTGLSPLLDPSLLSWVEGAEADVGGFSRGYGGSADAPRRPRRPSWVAGDSDAEGEDAPAEGEDDPKLSARRVASQVKWVQQWIDRAIDKGGAAVVQKLAALSAAESLGPGPSGEAPAARSLAADSLALMVSRVLLDPSLAVDDAAGELLDAVGYDLFDAVQEVLGRRAEAGAALQTAVKKAMEEEDWVPGAGAGDGGDAKADGPRAPIMVGSITVQSESDKRKEKEARRARKKGKTGAASPADPALDFISAFGLGRVIESAVGEAEGRDIGSRRMVFGDIEFRLGEGGPGLWTAGALPSGTTRKAYKGYEEVRVPAAAKGQLGPNERLVEIAEMDEWAQLAFQGYKTLNRIQSRIYSCAYHSNSNMLVCAPTGAGKTNIAMLSVLHEVAQNMKHGAINKADFKIIYVAPMKALAAEVTAAFSGRLAPLGLTVRELTGDMQLTKKEMSETQMIVTTPEKWDVLTRKGGDVSVASLVRLLILDEVHLLNDERGPVIETLVARTLRLVESTQSMIRIVGLSATLPNYKDVAAFLGVNTDQGLFYFDASYRPVPLEMQFLGVSVANVMARNGLLNELAYQKVTDSIKRGFQAMVFVHSRKDTGKTGRTLAEMASRNAEMNLFDTREDEAYAHWAREVKKSRNREVQELFEVGIGIHHAGMLRSDRTLTEQLFSRGIIKVLCCTATLAWGVNLPAHTVVIKGTQVYNPERGGFTDVSLLDVQQIFGRAGRPQFESSGEGIILTTHDKLSHYLGMLTQQLPIESKFINNLVDHLNAEIVLGTVTNIKEASTWLSYTYLYVRMMKNPLHYAIKWEELAADPRLEDHRRKLVIEAARELEKCRMARYDEKSGNLYVTELGRVASHYYLQHKTVIAFHEGLKQHMTEDQVLSLMAKAGEFEQLSVREDEAPELDKLLRDACPLGVKGGIDKAQGKANALFQVYISRARVETFSLVADMNYVAQNAPRIARALFEIAFRRGWPSLSETLLDLCKAFEQRVWPHQHALRQFEGALQPELLMKLEDHQLYLNQLLDMEASEIGASLRHPHAGVMIKDLLACFPDVKMEAQVQPITRSVLRVVLSVEATFAWREKWHGQAMRWLIWVEDTENEHIYHSETWVLTKKMAREGAQKIIFTIPIFEPLPTQYVVRAVSESWMHAETSYPMSFKGLILPERHPPHTELLDLDPLPRSALNNPDYESLYRFTHFNPIQTQAFHTLYHTDENVLLGAPTGSGKTATAELCMLRLFNAHPGEKVIYIAPLKALVRERIDDWGAHLCKKLGKRLVELTGDYTPDVNALLAADVIVATPEKWDGISRNWQTRSYVKKVGLVVIDEIHLLGADRGPILEVICSRMRYISSQTGRSVRIVGLSTALANAQDLADWLGIGPSGLFNFKPSVRPVPLEVHIQGYPGKFYCPRMATMNKPTYAAIQAHSPSKPVLVFVSSRRQTRLTALDLIAFAAADERPRQFVHMTEDELSAKLAGVKDPALKHSLQFGIGLHHAGLPDSDRVLVERLFVELKIQVLVATSTLAWGVNTPTHLVVIKGTEFFDAPSRRYVDFPITDVLQMMGRAGRPQYDRHGVAVIMVHDPKKPFYKKFLYEPFPVESSLAGQLTDHLNAEVVAGTIRSKQDAMDYLTWTYLFRRLMQNPTYYGLPEAGAEGVNEFLSDLVESSFQALESAGCVVCGDEDSGFAVEGTPAGRIASFYYLQHPTMQLFRERMGPDMPFSALLKALSDTTEYDELPVRHNEDRLNGVLARECRLSVDEGSLDSPHVKAKLLLMAHMSRLALPISDYVTDTKSVLDNSLRILQAMVDVSAEAGWLGTSLTCMSLVQAVMQARWPDEPATSTLPHVGPVEAARLAEVGYASLAALVEAPRKSVEQALLATGLSGSAVQECVRVVERLPAIDIGVEAKRVPSPRPDGEGVGKEDGGELAADGGWVIDVTLSRTRSGPRDDGGAGASRGAGSRKCSAPRAFAPRYPKIKEEGWWLVAGDPLTHELLALRRVSLGDRTKVSLRVPSRTSSGEELPEVTVYLVSDCYLGLDRQVVVSFGEELAGASSARRITGSESWNSKPGPFPPKPPQPSLPTDDGGGSDLDSLINLGAAQGGLQETFRQERQGNTPDQREHRRRDGRAGGGAPFDGPGRLSGAMQTGEDFAEYDDEPSCN